MRLALECAASRCRGHVHTALAASALSRTCEGWYALSKPRQVCSTLSIHSATRWPCATNSAAGAAPIGRNATTSCPTAVTSKTTAWPPMSEASMRSVDVSALSTNGPGRPRTAVVSEPHSPASLRVAARSA